VRLWRDVTRVTRVNLMLSEVELAKDRMKVGLEYNVPKKRCSLASVTRVRKVRCRSDERV